MYHPGMYHHRKADKDPASKIKLPRRSIDQKTYAELIKILDREFSVFRRMIAIRGGVVRCATCGTWADWKDMDLGHYITRAIHATRFEVMNTAVQCRKCNRFMGGMTHALREHLVEIYGEQAIKELEQRSKMGNVWTAELLREKILYYRERNARLRKEL